MYDQIYKRIDDNLWKDAGCGSELDYVEQSSWILFLKYLDDLEQNRLAAAELVLLQQSGVDLHSYSPTAADLRKIAACDLFVFVGGESDEWTERALAQKGNP